ncbi:MAG TPA: hypothetical protein VFR02_02340, partial [bacterium]|nr:hypothetical protein [bacterium]
FDDSNPAAAPTVVLSSLFFPTGLRRDLAGNFYVAESDNGGVAQFLDLYDPTLTTRENQCALPDVWGAAVNETGEVYVSGLNSFAVTEVQGCALEPTVTPTPAYQGASPPGAGGAFVYPSPVRGDRASVAYRLPAPAGVRLTVWNEAGEKITEVTDHRGAGVQATAFSVAGWSPGVYFYGLTLSYDSGGVEKPPLGKFAVIH